MLGTAVGDQAPHGSGRAERRFRSGRAQQLALQPQPPAWPEGATLPSYPPAGRDAGPTITLEHQGVQA